MSQRLPLIGGSYVARSIIANAQRCINLFPERNPADAPVPVTHYQRPGLRPLVAPSTAAPCRGVFRASNGNGYCVIGQNVYSISPSWMLTQIGQLQVYGTVPCSMTDNGIDALLVDSTPWGFTIHLADNTFTPISDMTGAFVGATRVDVIDTFVLWNQPGTNQFGSTLSNQITPFDPQQSAAKSDYPDPLVSLIVNRHEILLLGQVKSEIWYDAGNAQFPFAELPGAYIEHGLCAPYSLASQDISVYWLGQDQQGQGIVFRQRGYETRRISNHALEFAIQGYAVITDAVAYTYQQGGHIFYVLSFPSADATWVYDDATEEWHQRCWTDPTGGLHRTRDVLGAFIYGTNVVGDWENGTLYALDQSVFTDTVGGVAGPISWIRTFPHILTGLGPQGQLVLADGKRMQFYQFVADIEAGTDASATPPQVTLRYSDDRGRTFTGTILQSLGQEGEYLTQPSWRGTGIARDRIFELEMSTQAQCALNGAWVDARVEAS